MSFLFYYTLFKGFNIFSALVSVASFVHDWYQDDPNLMIRIKIGFSFSYFIIEILLSNLLALITAFHLSTRTKRFIKYITDIEKVSSVQHPVLF